MKYLGREIAIAQELTTSTSYHDGTWIAWHESDITDDIIVTVAFDDEVPCLRYAVLNGTNVAFVPWGEMIETYIKANS